MPNITLSITEKIKQEMEKHSEIRWSNAVRIIIEKKLQDFKGAERIANKSKLTEKDIRALSAKVSKDTAEHAKRLLHESNS